MSEESFLYILMHEKSVFAIDGSKMRNGNQLAAIYYYLLNALSRRRRKVNHVSFACAISHVIIEFVA